MTKYVYYFNEGNFSSDDAWLGKDLFGEAMGKICKVGMRLTMEKGIKLDKTAIKRINGFHESETIDDIIFIQTDSK